VPDKHAETDAVDESQVGEVNNGARPRLPPDVAKVRLQDRSAEGIQLTTQAHHGHIVAIVS
jgi:hypothetical protein